MINWYCRDGKLDSCSQRLREHYSSSSASYALFDYDLALQLPSTASLKDCRRPALEAFLGKSEYHPRDIHQGEGHYNPFAFDVACLGNLFLYHFVVCAFRSSMTLADIRKGGYSDRPSIGCALQSDDDTCHR